MTTELAGEATIVRARDDIEAARDRIAGHVRSTPVVETGAGAFGMERRSSSSSSCCSTRGRSSREERSTRCSPPTSPPPASSPPPAGTSGWRWRTPRASLGHRAEIFVPDTSPAAKIDRIRELGADVRVIPGYYHEASVAALARQTETGALAMHPFDQPEVVAGGGTIGIELAEQVPDADTVLVAVGGGGLIAGIASWFRGDVRVVGVEPERLPDAP